MLKHQVSDTFVCNVRQEENFSRLPLSTYINNSERKLLEHNFNKVNFLDDFSIHTGKFLFCFMQMMQSNCVTVWKG